MSSKKEIAYVDEGLHLLELLLQAVELLVQALQLLGVLHADTVLLFDERLDSLLERVLLGTKSAQDLLVLHFIQLASLSQARRLRQKSCEQNSKLNYTIRH